MRAALDRELPYLAADRASVVAETAALVTAARPDDPHWWLAHLGVRPTPVARVWPPPCSPRRWCAATPRASSPRPPSSSWANVRFLRGFGFEVTTTRTADDALPLWVLVRQPRPAVVG